MSVPIKKAALRRMTVWESVTMDLRAEYPAEEDEDKAEEAIGQCLSEDDNAYTALARTEVGRVVDIVRATIGSRALWAKN
jgi:hypothetical protein